MPENFFQQRVDTIIIKRNDIIKVHDYAQKNCVLRDYLLIRLPKMIGTRTNEICTLRAEYIDFESRMFQVLDSKKYEFYALPLDSITLELIKQLIGDRTEGYVFRQRKTWTLTRTDKPLTPCTVWTRVKHIAEDAGVHDFNPRMLRHYFAYKWHYIDKKPINDLRKILRHTSLTRTQIYVESLTCFEDLQQVYDEGTPVPALTGPCADCGNSHFCKYVGTLPDFATGCQFKSKIERLMPELVSRPGIESRSPIVLP
jgi:integrase